MPPQLPSKPQPKLQPKHQTQPSPKLPPKRQTQHQRSLERKELKRQHSLEPSRNRSFQPGPEVNRQEATQGNTELEKREGRGSPPPFHRPLSLPLDPKAGRYNSLPSLTSLPLTPSFTSDLSTVIADVCSGRLGGSGIPQVVALYILVVDEVSAQSPTHLNAN